MNDATFTPQRESLKQHWHFVDISGKVLGRTAVEIAKHLMGKNKAIFSRNINVGDKVVVTNAEKVRVTGKKLNDKLYYHHTGFPKGLRTEKLANLLERKPEEVIVKAVRNMLPNNKLRKERLSNLYVYKGTEHPHAAQNAENNKEK